MPVCPDCGVAEGQRHQSGCDVEVCQRCGQQALSCDCIYVINEMNPKTLAVDHPDIYSNGPTLAMQERWEKEWGDRAMIWTGEWPGKAECREFGWYSKMTSNGWQSCDKNEEGAVEDLNRLQVETTWDPVTQKRIPIPVTMIILMPTETD